MRPILREVNGKTYISATFLLHDKENAKKYINEYHRVTGLEFKWTPEKYRLLAGIVAMVGITEVKPEQLHEYFSWKYPCDVKQICSKLQKLRNLSLKKADSSFLRNSDCYYPDTWVLSLARQWENPYFAGFTEEQVWDQIADK